MNWQCLDAHFGLGSVPRGRDTVDSSALVELTSLSEGPQRSPHFLLFRQFWGRGTEMNPQLLEDEVGTCIIIFPAPPILAALHTQWKEWPRKAALSTTRFIGREWFKGANFKSFMLNLCGFFQRVYQEKKYIYSVKCPQFSYSIIPFFLMGKGFHNGKPLFSDPLKSFTENKNLKFLPKMLTHLSDLLLGRSNWHPLIYSTLYVLVHSMNGQCL